MKFRDLFEGVEDWFWKLEYNPETGLYEMYLGIPNDWVYSEKNESITIELIHKLPDNSIVKISSVDENVTIDDILDCAKQLITKNQELERRKQEHKEEMEKIRDMLIEKEKNFLHYIDTVKSIDVVVKKAEETNEAVSDTQNDAETNEGTTDGVKNDFLNDIEKLKLS
jgi:hypothetical protein